MKTETAPVPRRPVSGWGLVEAAGVLAGLATGVGWLGRIGWAFELVSHFRVQLALTFAVLGLIAVLGRRWKLAVLMLVGVAVNAVPIGLAIRPGGRPAHEGGRSIRLMALNVHTANTRSDLVLEAVRQADPDVLLLLEVNDRWMAELAPLQSNYPQVLAEPRLDNFGIALLSRWPIRQQEVLELGGVPVPSLAVELAVEGHRFWLLGTHPVPPGSPGETRERNRQLSAIADWAREQTGPTLVLGDLNATPWSPYFRDLVRESGLMDARPAWGLFTTWPARSWLLRLPLDHGLVSPDIRVVARRVGRDVGSDHLPIHFELVIPAP